MFGGLGLNRSHGYIIMATFGFSFILVFSTVLKNLGVSTFEQLSFRLGFGFIILLAAMLFGGRRRFIHRKDIPFFLRIGFTYALFGLCGLAAIAFDTPIPVAVALVYTQPIFTAAISHLTGKEKVSGLKIAVILLGVVGALLVSGLRATNQQIQLGIVFPVLAGFFYAVYLWLKRQAPVEEYAPFQVLANTFMFAIPFLMLAWLLFRNFSQNSAFVGVTMPTSFQLILLFAFSLFSTVLPYGLLNYVKPKEVAPTTEGLLLLGDPLMHTLWATLFFQEFISEPQYLGAALILISAALNLKIRTKTPTNSDARKPDGRQFRLAVACGILPLALCRYPWQLQGV